MNISRRKLLTCSAIAATCGFQFPTIAETVIKKPNNIDILLSNLREGISSEVKLSKLYVNHNIIDLCEKATIKSWNLIKTQKLIPTIVDSGYKDENNIHMVNMQDKNIMLRTRKLSARYTFEIAYDGCIGCHNGSRFRHDNETCEILKNVIEDEIIETLSIENADELDCEFSNIMYNCAKVYKTELPAGTIEFKNAVIDIIKQNRSKASWLLVAPWVAQIFFGIDQKSSQNSEYGNKVVGYFEGLPVYINSYVCEQAGLLIGYDGSKDPSIIWAPHTLLWPSGVVIDSNTFKPALSFKYKHGVWFDEEKAADHFILIQPEIISMGSPY